MQGFCSINVAASRKAVRLKFAAIRTRRWKPILERVKVIVWGRAAGRRKCAACNAPPMADEISGAVHANNAYNRRQAVPTIGTSFHFMAFLASRRGRHVR
jgi:hypothetical protein